MKLLIVLLGVFLTSQSYSTPVYLTTNDHGLFVDYYAKPAVSLSEMEKVTNLKDLKTVESFLLELPTSYRENYVLLRKSQSLQRSDDTHPRVILFGEDARFVVGYVGNPKYTNYYTLEIMEFDQDQKRFRFHEIDFDPKAERPPHFMRDSKRCFKCHEGAPNWDSYPFWRGAYGDHLDDVYGFMYRDDPRSGTEFPSKIGYEKFLLSRDSNPRYSLLSPIGQSGNLSKIFGFYKFPNTTFGILLSNLMHIHILQTVKKDSDFKYKCALKYFMYDVMYGDFKNENNNSEIYLRMKELGILDRFHQEISEQRYLRYNYRLALSEFIDHPWALDSAKESQKLDAYDDIWTRFSVMAQVLAKKYIPGLSMRFQHKRSIGLGTGQDYQARQNFIKYYEEIFVRNDDSEYSCDWDMALKELEQY